MFNSVRVFFYSDWFPLIWITNSVRSIHSAMLICLSVFKEAFFNQLYQYFISCLESANCINLPANSIELITGKVYRIVDCINRSVLNHCFHHNFLSSNNIVSTIFLQQICYCGNRGSTICISVYVFTIRFFIPKLNFQLCTIRPCPN